jgi:hypothetical protein
MKTQLGLFPFLRNDKATKREHRVQVKRHVYSNDLQHQFELNHELLKTTVHSTAVKNTTVISEINVNHR